MKRTKRETPRQRRQRLKRLKRPRLNSRIKQRERWRALWAEMED